jgi:hypothetical protein
LIAVTTFRDDARNTIAREACSRAMPLSYLYHPSLYVFANDDIRGLELDGVSPFASASHRRI